MSFQADTNPWVQTLANYRWFVGSNVILGELSGFTPFATPQIRICPSALHHCPNPAQNVRPHLVAADVRRLTIIPRSAPVPRRKLHPAKSWFLSAARPSSAALATSENLSTTAAHGTLSSILLNGREGRGEEALIKTLEVASRRFPHWLLGSNVETPANKGMYPIPVGLFFRFLALANPPPSCARKLASS